MYVRLRISNRTFGRKIYKGFASSMSTVHGKSSRLFQQFKLLKKIPVRNSVILYVQEQLMNLCRPDKLTSSINCFMRFLGEKARLILVSCSTLRRPCCFGGGRVIWLVVSRRSTEMSWQSGAFGRSDGVTVTGNMLRLTIGMDRRTVSPIISAPRFTVL